MLRPSTLSSSPFRRALHRSAWVAAAVAALVTTGAVSASADTSKPPAAASVSVVTVDDRSNQALPVRTAVRAWDHAGAALDLQLGSCSGRGCVVVTSVTAMPPGTCFVSTAGCSWMGLDGTCTVAVDDASLQGPYISRWAVLSVTTHEIGHCLGMPHLPALTSIMHNPMSSTDPVRAPSVEDLQYLCAVWSGAVPPYIP